VLISFIGAFSSPSDDPTLIDICLSPVSGGDQTVQRLTGAAGAAAGAAAAGFSAALSAAKAANEKVRAKAKTVIKAINFFIDFHLLSSKLNYFISREAL
jgi:hypothetical protein